MKKGTFFVIVSLVFTCAMLCSSEARVTFHGQRGLLRVHSAKGSERGLLVVNLHNEGRYEKDVVIPLDRPDAIGNAYFLTSHIGLTYGITDYVEISAALSILGDIGRQTSPKKRYDTSEGLGDAQLGLKLSYPGELPDVVDLGVQGFVVLPMGKSDKGIAGVREGYFTRDKTYGGGRLLVDLNFGQIDWYLNGGFLAVSEDTLFPNMFGPQSNQILFGTGVEYVAGPLVTLFAEVTGEYTDTDVLEKKTALRLTPGVRLFGKNTPVDIGVDVRLSPEESSQPDWNLIAGFSIGSLLRATTGVFYGTIVDAETQRPIAATINFPGTTIQTLTTDDVTGSYEIELAEGEYTIVVSHPDYFSQKREGSTIVAGKRLQLNFALEAKPRVGKITGKIVDSRTKGPLDASISFPEVQVESVKSNPSTGMYEASLPEGTILVKVESEGYISLSEPVVVKRDETEIHNFALELQVVPKGKITGQVTDTETDSVLSATVTFLDTDIPPLNTDKSGIYSADLPPGTYRVEAVTEGYTSKLIPVVVEDGKTILQNFALRRIPKKGEVISLRGIKFDTGKSTIRPESYGVLDEAALLLKEIPTLRVQIQGHTDSVGGDEYNQRLSEDRANAVRNYLISRHEIKPDRIEAIGLGESRPVADNNTPEGRQLNRRIDFVILESR